MSDTGKHIVHYSAADIQKYLKGELSARDMYEMEKAALDDPFLADALEGFEQRPAVAADLQELHARLTARVNEKDKPRILIFRTPWLRLAAAAVLLLGLGGAAYMGGTVYSLLQGSSHPAESLAKTPVPSTPSVADTAAIVSAETPVAASPAKSPAAPPVTARSNQPAQATTRARSRTTSAVSALAKAAEPDTEALALAKTAGSGVTAPAASPDVLKSDSILYDTKRSLTLTNRNSPMVLAGKVLDQHNNPLPGATLQLTGQVNGVVTNQEGYFKLKVKPQDSANQLTIAMLGYEQKSLALNTLSLDPSTGNLIRLQPNQSALDEVVVVGYGAKRKETRMAAGGFGNERIDSLWTRVLPVMGRQAYLDYLATAKSKLTVDSIIKGTVIISFNVDKNGVLSSFKVEQSLSPAHDAGVIRLVSEGPAWHVLRGRNVRAEVRMTF
jgi:hypothetical protein